VTEATNEPGSSGLLDSVTVEDSSKPAEPTAAAIPHKAIEPGSEPEDPLERPDYWPENFWKKDANEPDLEGIAKSWRDLRAKISKGHHNAPADGNYDMGSFGDTAADNPMAQELAAFAKDNGLSQAQFDDLATRLRTKASELMDGEPTAWSIGRVAWSTRASGPATTSRSSRSWAAPPAAFAP